MKAPRVLVSGVLLAQPMGGVRRHNQELLPRAAERLARAGGALAVLEGARPPALALPPAVERLRSRVPAHPAPLRALGEGRALRAALARAARAGRPFDVVHTAHLPAPRLEGGARLVLTLHDTRRIDLARGWRARLGRAAVERSLARAAVACAVSETMARRLAVLGARRVALVRNAADHLPLLPRAPADPPFLLCVGHLEPRKNPELLVRALALDAGLPDLVLAGAAKGAAGRELAALAARLGVAEHVRALGAIDDGTLAELYARAACVVLPSRLEGFGIPALEAQRAGAPLAVADAGALPEVAPRAPRFAPDDAAGCARAIRSALATPTDALARAAADAAAHTWDDAADALVEAWRLAAEG